MGLASLDQLPDSALLPPATCCWLRARDQGATRTHAGLSLPAMNQNRLGSGFYLLPFPFLCLPRFGTIGPPQSLANETRSP